MTGIQKYKLIRINQNSDIQGNQYASNKKLEGVFQGFFGCCCVNLYSQETQVTKGVQLEYFGSWTKVD